MLQKRVALSLRVSENDNAHETKKKKLSSIEVDSLSIDLY